MPKETYNNLKQDKKDRIFNAGVLEFSYHDFNSASVNTIVRIANISKGSFYQYFYDKDDFYWFIVMKIIFLRVGKYEDLLKRNDGDFFKTELELFQRIMELFEDNKYKAIMINVYGTKYMDLNNRLTGKGSTIYFDMYDLLMEFGFKGYNIKSKDDFLIVFEMVRNISNNTIMTMINENQTRMEAIRMYDIKMDVLRKGIAKRGWF